MKKLFAKFSAMMHKKSNLDADPWSQIVASIEKAALAIKPQLGHRYHLKNVIFDCPSETHKMHLMTLFSPYGTHVSEAMMQGERLNKFVENHLRTPIHEVKVDASCAFSFVIHQMHSWEMNSLKLGCVFQGEWEKINPETCANPTLTLEIKDAQGIRTLTLETFPVVVGKLSSEPDIRIDAMFTSGKHAILQYEAGSVVWEDTSTNGTFINGEKIHHQSKALKGKEVMILGSNTKQSYADFAQITVLACVLPSVSDDTFGLEVSATPMMEVIPTPCDLEVQPTPMKKIMYHIDVSSYEGSTTYDCEERFPITIGRGKEQTIRIPSDPFADPLTGLLKGTQFQRNTVSRHHLEILGITPKRDALRIKSVGTHGTTLEGKRMEGEIEVPFNHTMELGIDNPPVRITIRLQGVTP